MTAMKEKAYIFVVVNRFDSIENKERCKREIMNQLRDIAPRTFHDAPHLVHFVSSKSVLMNSTPEPNSDTDMKIKDFLRLEDCLCDFILSKRARSKLSPAKLFLSNLASDIMTLCTFNARLNDTRRQEALKRAEARKPLLERLQQVKAQTINDLDRMVDDAGSLIQFHAQNLLRDFIENIENISSFVEWHGIVYAWAYAGELRNHLKDLAAARIKNCEEHARITTRDTLHTIQSIANGCFENEDLSHLKYDDDDDDNNNNNNDFSLQSRIQNESMISTMFESKSGSDNLNVNLEIGDFFSFEDRISILREYIPSTLMILTGLVGYRQVAATLIRTGGRNGLFSLVKGGFLGLAVTGSCFILLVELS